VSQAANGITMTAEFEVIIIPRRAFASPAELDAFLKTATDFHEQAGGNLG
jgi:hypothetical protein